MCKTIKSANIEVVSPQELKIGDFVLLKNHKREIIDINEMNRFIVVPDLKHNCRKGYNMTSFYYRIKSCEEEDTPDAN